ncbi:acyl-CoA thioesterase [Virgibacillus ainsalahensis]
MKSIPYVKDLEEWRAGFTFSIPINIRFSETDMFGHVNNVSPFIYFEEARIAFLQRAGMFNDEKNEEGMPVVADLQCDYHQQIYFHDHLKLYVKVDYVGNTSFDIHYMALNDKNEITLTGRGRMVYINPGTGKPVPLTDLVKNKLMEINDR